MPSLSQMRALAHVSASPRAAALMFLSCIMFSITMSVIRYLSQSLPPMELVFFRNMFGLMALAPLFLRTGIAPLRTRRFGLHLLRGLSSLTAMAAFFYAIAVVPLADAVALGFTALFPFGSCSSATIGAVIFLTAMAAFFYAIAVVPLRSASPRPCS